MTDLKMHDGDGFSVLENCKHNPAWRIIPTIVLSASSDVDDIKQSYILGASSYLVKPASFEDLSTLIGKLYGYWQDCEVPEMNESGKMGERFSQE